MRTKTVSEQIMEILEASPFQQMTFAGIVRKLGKKPNGITNQLATLQNQGKITHSKSGKDGIYSLVKSTANV